VVAEALRVNLHTARHYPGQYPDLWRRLYAEAWDGIWSESRSEAVETLRRNLTTGSDTAQVRAAQVLLVASERRMPDSGPRGGAPLEVNLDHRDLVGPVAPRPVRDREAPGEDESADDGPAVG